MGEASGSSITENTDDQVKIFVLRGKDYHVSRSALVSNSQILNSMIEVHSRYNFPFIHLNLAEEHVNQIIETIEGREPLLESVKNAKEMYLLSRMYYIEKLEKLCRDYLIRNINNDNVSYIHDFACEQNDTLMQYHCWEKFDRDWESIFKQEDFLHCKTSTIDRLLSRPKYDSLPEVELFKAVYNWVKTKHQQVRPEAAFSYFDTDNLTLLEEYRFSMQPFLLKIRFLTMTLEALNHSVFKLDLLTETEMQAIRDFILTKRKDNFPETICPDFKNRITINIKDPSLFHYNNKESKIFNRGRRNFLRNLFKSEVFLNSDCFLTAVKLPITHENDNGIIAFFEIFMIPEINPIKSQFFTCDKDGIIHIKEPIFLIGNSTFLVSVRIPESEKTERNYITFSSDVHKYIGPEDSNAIYEIKTESRSVSSVIFCEVVLYF